ncbi:hypothetical protein V8D89_001747 [Ganoderma adspersum]
MAMERPQYARIESVYGSTPASVSVSVTAPQTPTSGAPRTLRHKVSRAFSTLTRRDPSSPERERGPVPPLPTPTALSPTSTSSTSTSTTSTETGTEKPKERERERQNENALKRTWGRSVAIARARSEPALRVKRAKAAATALAPPVKPSRSAPVTTHSRDVNAYVPSEGAVVSYTYPLWRIDPVLVGCFVCL